MNDAKIQVTATGEKILFGKNIIELEDLSRGKFITKNLDSFKKFLPGKTIVYVDDLTIAAFNPGTKDKVDYTAGPLAECKLNYSPILQVLRSFNKRELDLVMFGELLRSMKMFLTGNTLQVLDALNDLKIKKIIEINHQSDKRGNFCFTVRADKGKQDYEFPQTIGFKVPLLENNEEIFIVLDYELLFTWGMKEAEVEMSFKIVNYSQDIQIEHAVKETVTKIFEETDATVYIGRFDIIRETDKFKYQESNLNL